MSAGNGRCPVLPGSLPQSPPPALSLDLQLCESWQGEQEEPEDLDAACSGKEEELPSCNCSFFTHWLVEWLCSLGRQQVFPGGTQWQAADAAKSA